MIWLREVNVDITENNLNAMKSDVVLEALMN